jgi:SNF2 family DNA or RNA helicase
LYEFRFGGILADDMGLGKTVQTLAFLQVLKEQGKLKKAYTDCDAYFADWKLEK